MSTQLRLDRANAAFQVAIAALAGPLAGAVVLAACGVGDALSDSRTIFLFSATDAAASLAVIGWMLRRSGEGRRSIGLQWQRPLRESAIGLAVLPLLWLSIRLTSLTFERFLPSLRLDENPLLELIRDPQDLALILTTALISGGFKEEVQRAFVLNRFRSHLGGQWLGLALWSAFFGWMHASQGIEAAFQAGLIGAVLGLLYLQRRNLIAPIAAHSLFNLWMAVLAWNANR